MNLRYIRYFLAVAETLSFTRAANKLHISQPALSQHIRALEEDLGTQLFDRSGRQIRLTDTGEVYLEFIRKAFQAINEGQRAIHNIADLSRGNIRLAVTPTFITYFISPLLRRLYELYPKVHLEVQSATQDKIEQMLLNDEIDVGIAFGESHFPNIAFEKLLVERLAMVVPQNHPLSTRQELSIEEIYDYPLVLLNKKFATRGEIDDHFRQAGIHLQAHTEVDSISAIVEIIRQTPLVTIIPENITRHKKDLVAIKLPGAQFERTGILLWRKDAWQSVAMKECMRIAKEVAKDL